MRLIVTTSRWALLGALAVLSTVPVAAAGKASLAVSSATAVPSLEAAMRQEGKTASLNRLLDTLNNQLIDRLNATHKFDIVARSDLTALFQEQKLARSGNVDTNDVEAARAGMLKGAQYAVVTTLDDFEDTIARMKFPLLQQIGIKRKLRVSAVAKVYNTTTGELAESANIRVAKQTDRAEATGEQSDADPTDALLAAAARDVAQQIAEHVLNVAFPARVLVKHGEEIILNRGQGTGIAVGQVWDAFALGEPMIDPDTKESLGRAEIPAGKVRIIWVNPKTATAQILKDKGIRVGGILRRPPTGAAH